MDSKLNHIILSVMVTISNDDIDDIMSAALDGGITYWCNRAEVIEDSYFGEYSSDQISRDGSLRLYDSETEDVYVLTKEKFLSGFKTAYEAGYINYIDALDGGKVDASELDAADADAIVQCALFGDVIYG